jgi:predicted lipoprotein with Yx(FWY)xxD motif
MKRWLAPVLIVASIILVAAALVINARGSGDDDDNRAAAAANDTASTSAADSSQPGSSQPGSSQPGSTSTVGILEIDDLGRVLTDAEGMVLYASDEEAADPDVLCTDACEEFWIPLDAGSGTPTGADGVTGLDVAERPDGTMQVTLDGRRLYTFSEDSTGEASGEGFSDTFGGQRFTWHAVVVDASGSPVTSATTGATAGTAGATADDEVGYPGY